MDYRELFRFEKKDKQFIADLCKEFGASHVVFFGSILNGYLLPRSDIDIAVIKPTEKNKKELLMEFSPFKKRLREHFQRSVDSFLIPQDKYDTFKQERLSQNPYEEWKLEG